MMKRVAVLCGAVGALIDEVLGVEKDGKEP